MRKGKGSSQEDSFKRSLQSSLQSSPRKALPKVPRNSASPLFGESTKRLPYVASSAEVDLPAPQPLTPKEKRVLEFLEFYVRDHGISPTYQEICRHFGFASFNSVQRYLKQLETKGYVRIPWGNQKRAISLLRPSTALQEAALRNAPTDAGKERAKDGAAPMPPQFTAEVFALPLLGRVAAGSPIEAYDHDEFIDVPASLVRQADRTYALRVQGQSMIEDGILDGDVILVQRQSRAENGEIVVAVINEEATVKRLYLHAVDPRDVSGTGDEIGAGVAAPVVPYGAQQMIELRPANSTMESMWFEPGEVQIRGVVVGLIRRF